MSCASATPPATSSASMALSLIRLDFMVSPVRTRLMIRLSWVRSSVDVGGCGGIRQSVEVAFCAGRGPQRLEPGLAELRLPERAQGGGVIAAGDENPVGHAVGVAANLLLRGDSER